jgi:hypothetical protein
MAGNAAAVPVGALRRNGFTGNGMKIIIRTLTLLLMFYNLI